MDEEVDGGGDEEAVDEEGGGGGLPLAEVEVACAGDDGVKDGGGRGRLLFGLVAAEEVAQVGALGRAGGEVIEGGEVGGLEGGGEGQGVVVFGVVLPNQFEDLGRLSAVVQLQVGVVEDDQEVVEGGEVGGHLEEGAILVGLDHFVELLAEVIAEEDLVGHLEFAAALFGRDEDLGAAEGGDRLVEVEAAGEADADLVLSAPLGPLFGRSEFGEGVGELPQVPILDHVVDFRLDFFRDAVARA